MGLDLNIAVRRGKSVKQGTYLPQIARISGSESERGFGFHDSQSDSHLNIGVKTS
ncbi:hypothetical protein GCM10011498_34890 [Amylibacter cionae]|uniref:Uncharacterized protein n=1 Tax=Neptunicoccus cionae TaxID=2035344 RepID=A0A916VT92_9RHOB|nr:hypothetical protein GCM10011498_34890 [Amylibacter cionae]